MARKLTKIKDLVTKRPQNSPQWLLEVAMAHSRVLH